jgi:hypothetical protein
MCVPGATGYRKISAELEPLRRQEWRGARSRRRIRPLVFNRAQQHIHAQLEAQRAAIGKVRALILTRLESSQSSTPRVDLSTDSGSIGPGR